MSGMETLTPKAPADAGCLKVRPLELLDSTRLAPLLRAGDVRELQLLGWTPNNALWTAAMLNYDEDQVMSWALFSSLRGTCQAPIAAFGYHSQSNHIWMLGQPLLRQEQVTLIRHTKEWVDFMLKASGEDWLGNTVAAFNGPAVNWLERSKAFDVDRETPYIIGGSKFYRFETKPLETLH